MITTHGSLFSGIGGFDLAAQWMGWENGFHCEINPFCKTILKHYWPNATSYDNIKETDFTGWNGKIDILTGGFPCQPYSMAGARKGKDDERHLWPEMLRAIREIRPRYVVGENVRGLISWNGGMVFDEVQTDLEADGYEVFPVVLPAGGVGAPHKRERIWFVAHADSGQQVSSDRQVQSGRNTFNGNTEHSTDPENGARTIPAEERTEILHTGRSGENECFTDAARIGFGEEGNGHRGSGLFDQTRAFHDWRDFPTQFPVRTGDDGLSGLLDIAALLDGRKPRSNYKADRDWNARSIEGGGNAICPQLAFRIFRAIEQADEAHRHF